jgi:hypothetical protein
VPQGATWHDHDEVEARSPVDDSRVPTEESTVVAAPTGEPAFGLRAAITRHDEPGLGLSVEDTNLPHEGQPFLDPGSRGVRVSLDRDPEIDPDDLDWRPQRRTLPRLLVVLALVVVAGGAFAVGGTLMVLALVAPVAAPTPAPLIAEPIPAPAEIPAESVKPAPAPAPDAPPEPAPPSAAPVSPPAVAATAPPPPAAAPPPEPPAPPPEPKPRVVAPTTKRLVDQGWSKVESDPEGAADAFRTALDRKPGDPEASYGLGYAMLKLGQRNGAKAYLCAAMNGADARTASEVRAVLSNAGLSCE